MKTTKYISILLMLILLLQINTACQNNPPPLQTETSLQNNKESSQVIQVEEYSILVYQNSVGFKGDTVTPPYKGEDFYAQENYSKSNVTTKRIDIAGNEIHLTYNKSAKLNIYQDDIDIYETSYENRLLRIENNAKTGNIVRYIRYAPCTDRGYLSEVTIQSTQEDYIQYVKKVIWEQTGVSVDGRDVKISTKIIKENGSPEYAPYFVNQSNLDENFNAEYTFAFGSEIDGIKRTDDITITITNVGEICSLTALVNDEAYRPFEAIEIDQPQLIEKIDNAFMNVRNTLDVISYNTTLHVLPNETELWVEATIEYNYQVDEHLLTGGVKYLIKVAELTSQ